MNTTLPSSSTRLAALEVFEVFHYLIEADRDIAGHELWMLAHLIVFPTDAA